MGKFERKADRINAQRKAEVPLFAEHVELTTARDEYWRWRRNISRGVEHNACTVGNLAKALDLLELLHLEGLIKPLIPNHYADLHTYCRSVWSSHEYWWDFWRGVLTGSRRIVYRWKIVGIRETKYGTFPRVEEDGVFPPAGWTPLLSKEQVDALFAQNHGPTEILNPDDGGAYQRLQDVLNNSPNKRI